MTSKIPRAYMLTQSRFVEEFLQGNQPVIVTGEATKWPAHGKWSPEYLVDRFGERDVLVYNSLFSLTDMTTLSDYVKRNFDKPDQKTHEYIRWYSRLSDLEIPWSDSVFDELSKDWQHPSFLPSSAYVLPFCTAPDHVSAAENFFPYRGLFISARSARTRLHRDPLGSQAVLWQVYGEKDVTFYHPKHDGLLRDGREFFDPTTPDANKFPRHADATPAFRDTLEPGEILFIPDGWFHDVTCLSDSISVTWNFVCDARAEPFLQCLENEAGGGELDTVRFFLAGMIDRGISAAEIATVVRRHLASRAAHA